MVLITGTGVRLGRARLRIFRDEEYEQMQGKKDAGKAVEVAEDHGITRRQFLARGAAFSLAAAVTGPGLTVLSGCGGDNGGSASGPMTFWQFHAPGGAPAESKWFKDLVDEWNGENEAKVELKYVPVQDYIEGTKLQTAFSSGEGPDIFLASSNYFLIYYNNDALLDLTPFIKQEAQKDFYENVMATRMVDDKIYAVPTEVEPLAMYYSVKAFEDAGLSEADVPETWDQLLDVAGRLKKGDRFGLLFDPNANFYQNFTWYPFMWQAGGEAVARSGRGSNFDSEGTVQALRFWQDAVQSGAAPRKALGAGANDISANLASGYCAIQQCGIWALAELQTNAPDFEYGVFKLPVPPGGTYTTNMGGWAWVANSQGKNPEAAGRFIAWAVGSMSEGSIERGTKWMTEVETVLAPRASVAKRAEEQGFFESAEGSETLRYFRDQVFPGGRAEARYPAEVNKPVNDAIQACMLDGASPEEQARQTDQRIESFLEGYSGAKLI